MASYATTTPYNNYHTGASPSRRSWADPRDGGAGNGSGKVYRHVKDIIKDAQPKSDVNTPLPQCLTEAEAALQLARSSQDFGRPDVAFKNYMKSFEIAVSLIPSHKDYGFFCGNNQHWRERHHTLCRQLSDMEQKMDDVKKIIEDNNTQHGVQPQTVTSRQVYDSGFGVPTNTDAGRDRPASSQREPTAVGLPPSLRVERARPASRPKPESLQGRPLPETSNDLSERFAKLRTAGVAANGMHALEMPRASDFQTSSRERPQSYSPQSGAALGSLSPLRPGGPRGMPSTPNGPAIPPKIPITTNIAMPKPPSPTYSPVSASTASLHVPRSSVDSPRPGLEKRQTYYNQPTAAASAASLQLQRTKDELSYRPKTPNGVNYAAISKSSSNEIPHKTMIDAPTLQDYMKRYNVLLVDIRDRSEFDDGHIFATSILCIEPITLKEGMSAEDLEDRMVVAPETEQSLFARRNQFDILVYYDQSTSSDSYLKGPPTQSRTPELRAFFDTVYEFNESKPLRDGRRPALLRGGIDAWTDFMGHQSLAKSNTAATLGSTNRRTTNTPGRPIARQRMASSNSRYEVRNRRLRDHKFLDENEQEAWRQQAQDEEVAPNEGAGSEEDYVVVEEEDQPSSPFVPDYETFLRRFPLGEQQSMTTAPRRPMPPPQTRHELPARLAVPSIPTRPAPAIPRPSYSGQADMNQSQAALARVTSGSRQPLYTSGIAQKKRLPKTGLVNFGVTCYMNSTLQCMSATVPLSQFFESDDLRYRQYIQKNWKGSSGIMPEIFANVVRSLWKEDVMVIKPSTFRNFCGRMNREWVIDRQQDAKEFFDFLVDCLHEDLNVNWERSPLQPLSTAQELERERLPISRASSIEWQRYEHRDRSFVSSLFAGQHASRLRCLTCGKTSTTYEAFYSISVEIPKSGQGDIYSCLRSYTQEERLARDESWRCPYCQCEREATKQIVLTRLPQFLVIHFKRFSASKTESARKIHTPIEFPLHGLSMDDFVIPRPPAGPGEDGTIDMATTPPYNYDAYGVLRHLGSSGDGGHYVSIVKDPGRGCWRKFDDDRYVDLDPAKLSARDRLQNPEAYIVFFQRSAAR